jgi:dynein heavy chain
LAALLQGARFSFEADKLAESLPGELHAPMPLLWLRPALASSLQHTAAPHFETPLYRTGERRGTLSTTGHSTNFVMFLKLPTDVPPEHWVKRGVAALCQLDD